jgi:hypothetical protein
MTWGTLVEIERRNRIRASLAAYTYEFQNTSIMSDAEFDNLCKQIDVSVSTDNPRMDKFFREHFQPDTGMWIRKHPELHKLAIIYKRVFLGNG